MKAQIDIENSKTQIVESIEVSILESKAKNFTFDISNITEYELNILNDAINPKLTYTDIEMFFVEDSIYSNFGPDYEYKIQNKKLYCYYIRDKWLIYKKD